LIVFIKDIHCNELMISREKKKKSRIMNEMITNPTG